MDFVEMMSLDARGGDTFLGASPSYPWGGVFGGQIAAQALWAAGKTLNPGYAAHALHAAFLRGAKAEEPLRFEVGRTADGRSFAGRSVIVRQRDGPVMTMIAGFHNGRAGEDELARSAPAVPSPEELESGGWSSMFDCRFVPHRGELPSVAAWMRLNDPCEEDPILAACAIALLADDLPGDAVLAARDRGRDPAAPNGPSYGQSLDHNVWFHRPASPGEWQLLEFSCHSLAGGRGCVVGNVFSRAGAHLATVGQQVLIRAGVP